MYFNPSAREFKITTKAADSLVETFHRALPDYNVTPLTNLPRLAQELGLGRVLVKDESHRFGLPAFKILGASWAIHKAVASKCGLSPTSSLEDLGTAAREANLALVTCTEGNWGRATARMARYLGIASTIYVPKFMDAATRVKIRNEGANVVVVNGDYDVSIQEARNDAKQEGKLLVMDVSWEGYEEIPEVRRSTAVKVSTHVQLLISLQVGSRGIQYLSGRNRCAAKRDCWETSNTRIRICWCRIMGTGGRNALQGKRTSSSCGGC